MTPSPKLEGFHEISLPDPISWLPQTAGWYALFGLVLLALAWRGYGRLRRFLANRYRRLALAELAAIERELRVSGKRAPALLRVPVLMKRTALSTFQRTEVAELSGEKWLSFLDQTLGGKDFREGPGRLLRELAYMPAPRLEELPEESIWNLLRLARRWIEEHLAIHQETAAVNPGERSVKRDRRI